MVHGDAAGPAGRDSEEGGMAVHGVSDRCRGITPPVVCDLHALSLAGIPGREGHSKQSHLFYLVDSHSG